MEGWFKVHRKIINSPIFHNDKALKVWIWCLSKATYKDYTTLVGNQIVNLKAGQFIFGRKKASEELKMKESTIYVLMKLLEKLEQITINSNNKFSLVTIVNWELYQTDNEEINNRITTNQQQSNNKVTQTRIIKNNKNKKNNITSLEKFYNENDIESLYEN